MEIDTETNENISNQMRSAAFEWVLASTSHGIPSIFRVKGVFLKLIWICCFLASFIYCIISIGKSIQDFLSYPTQVSISLVQEIPTKFPAITICNTKSLDKIKANTMIDGIVRYSNGSEKVPLETFQDYPSAYLFLNLFLFKSEIATNKKFNDSLRRAIGFELSNMIMSCSFYYEVCNENDFKYFYNSIYGSCYTFNSGYFSNGTKVDVKNVTQAGANYGFSIELFIGDRVSQSRYEYSDGVIVSIHNQSVLPNFETDRIFVPSGAETDLSVKRTFVSRLGPPYYDCLVDTSKNSSFHSYYFDYIVRTNGMTYTQKYCSDLCMQKLLNNECNCSTISLPLDDNSPFFCNSDIERNCSQSIFKNFDLMLFECKKGCPLECNTVEYFISSSRLTYPSVFYRNVLANYSKIKSSGIANEDIDKTVLKLNVFYANTQYTLIKEQASTTNEQLLSNIGGILGLCIGVSLLSLVEIVEIIITLFHIWFKHKIKEINKVNGKETTEKGLN